MSEKRKTIAVTLIFFALLLLPQLLQHLVRSESDTTAENRNPAPFPRTFKYRKFASEFEEFYNDRIPFRSQLLKYCEQIQRGLFTFTLGNAIAGKNGFCFYTPRSQENTYLQYTGKLHLPYYKMEKNRRFLEKLHQELARKNIKFLWAVAPDKIQIYPEYLPERRRTLESPSAPAEKFRRHLDNARSPVPRLFLKETLLANKRFSGKLFYRADTHWSRVGGYLGAREIISHFTRGSTPLPEAGKFRIYSRGGHYEPDDMKNQLLHRAVFKRHPECFPLVPSFTGKVEEVSRGYLRTRNPAAPDRRKVLIYRDSFTINMLPYLSYHFAEVHYLWTHKVSLSQIEQLSPDIVILEYVSRLLVKMQNKLRL